MEQGTDIGFWELSIIMVVIASWILYRYVAPKGWKEWAGAGLVQAFIIALYAEMYGFPLTIYLLTGWLGIKLPWAHDTGHLWAYLFGWGPLGVVVEMLVGYALVITGISLLAEGWREVYIATKNGRLAKDKLYGVVRHPQYTGIYLAVFGQLIHWPTIPTVVIFPVIVLAYYRLAKKEEEKMVEQFGEAYEVYRQCVPMFFPRQGEWRKLMSVSEFRKYEP